MVFGSALSLLGLLANEWMLRAWLGAERLQGPSSRLLLGLADLLLLAAGACFLLIRRREALFRAVLAVFNIGMVVVIGLAGMELYVRASAYRGNGGDVSLDSAVTSAEAYRRFGAQYIHPLYYSFFLLDPAVLGRINNDIVSLDRNGFRGPGPEQKGDRKLAFLLGGSAAFGVGSSTNNTTISGYLNALQGEYHVVNAGVPAWISTQEFYRLALELLPYRPDLVLVYDGSNDAFWNYHHHLAGRRFPPGTPAAYEYIESWGRELRKSRIVTLDPGQLRSFLGVLTFFAARRVIDAALSRPNAVEVQDAEQSKIVPEPDAAVVRQSARAYLRNLENMNHLATGYGARLVVFWQAVLTQHRNTSPEARDEASSPDVALFKRRFHDYVFANKPSGMEIVDLSDVFDQYSADVSQAGVFQDEVHLSDHGNEIVAREMLRRLHPSK